MSMPPITTESATATAPSQKRTRSARSVQAVELPTTLMSSAGRVTHVATW